MLTPAQIKSRSFESRWNSLVNPGGRASCLRACYAAMLLPQSLEGSKEGDKQEEAHVKNNLKNGKSIYVHLKRRHQSDVT